MKKLFTILIIAVMAIIFTSCNNKTWSTALGNASFATNRTWTISGNDITQIWSDAVQTDRCSNRDEEYILTERSVFNIDCRSNPEFPGDLFCWQAVYQLASELCPYPWRVPTKQDFMDLDIALGGTGRPRGDTPEFVVDNYINRWGGAFGGISISDGSLKDQGSWGFYWSQSERTEDRGYLLIFTSRGSVFPQNWSNKSNRLSLRCIR
ncbi:MAG: fibrobacter succinogenes major paralogous domain-containing protein [Bacteroidales bacterium]|nr:fibrobacter succinogenes major paralogous domain-containing protein [Bacteroidales bacterium]